MSVSFTLDSAFCHCSWESSGEDGPGAQVITPTEEAWQKLLAWLNPARDVMVRNQQMEDWTFLSQINICKDIQKRQEIQGHMLIIFQYFVI